MLLGIRRPRDPRLRQSLQHRLLAADVALEAHLADRAEPHLPQSVEAELVVDQRGAGEGLLHDCCQLFGIDVRH